MKPLNKLLGLTLSFSILSACDPISEDAAHIQLGRSNQLFSVAGLQYQQPMVVQVSDINGEPAANSTVRVKVLPLEFIKGEYVWLDDNEVETTVFLDAKRWSAKYSIYCAAEDTDLDGVLDAGEDLNGNGVLDPSNPATLTAHPTEVPTLNPITNRITTDSNGFGYFTVTYPKTIANWARVNVVASVSVSGTESEQSMTIDLAAIRSELENVDMAPPGGLVQSPFGVVASCLTDL